MKKLLVILSLLLVLCLLTACVDGWISDNNGEADSPEDLEGRGDDASPEDLPAAENVAETAPVKQTTEAAQP